MAVEQAEKLTVLGQKPTNVKGAFLYIFYANGSFFEKRLDDTFIVGTDSHCEVQLSSEAVSGEHGEFLIAPSGYMYRDLFSKNGSYINGERIGEGCARQGKRLEHGDIIQIKTGLLACAEVTMIYTCADGKPVWYEQPLDSATGDIEIGRAVSHGLQFSNDAVSRRHATFHRGVNGWSIIDHNSKNGVFVNGAINSEYATTELRQGDVVRIVNNLFVFMVDKLLYCIQEGEQPARVVMASQELDNEPEIPDVTEKTDTPAKDEPTTPEVSGQLTISIKKRVVRKMFTEKRLLEDINLSVSSGNLVLILGGSGAGKSTFIKAVLGYEKADATIKFEQTDIYNDYNKVKNMLGYATQECLLRESDIVWDTLYRAAELRMPAACTKAERNQRVEQVLELLGLQREVKTQVKNLSGGQQKRLGIAVEYISDPKIFFLDEPDSGLDGMMAIDLMKSLRVMADDNKIVMVISHAPDRVAELFDKVIVLAKSIEKNSGQLAFFGDINEAKEFFEVDSLEHIVRRINRPDENGEGLSDFYIDKFKNYRR